VGVSHSSSSGTELPETLLHATGSHGGKSLIMATGWIESEMEGLFTLDQLTGALQCWVLNSRTGTWGANFVGNVMQDLQIEAGKEPSFVMVTGQAQFTRGGSAMKPANSVVYVADENTGNFVAYGMQWNSTVARTGAVQQNLPFIKLGIGKARELMIRE
jgi:hypothetical protein